MPLLPEKEKLLPDAIGWWARRNPYDGNRIRWFFVEKITLSADGKSFTSKIKYDQFDTAGKPAEGGGVATGKGVRLAF